MNLSVSDFLDVRINETLQDLRDSNSEYAFAKKRIRELLDNIEPFISRGRDITFTVNDCLDLQEFFEHEFASNAIRQKELYKQGYLDCVKLLGKLGVL